MSYGILLVGIGVEEIDPPEWVVEFDPDAHAPGRLYPTGDVVSDADPAKALRFETSREAMDTLLTQSTVCPLRPDGRPNRPLMAFSTQVAEVPESVA